MSDSESVSVSVTDSVTDTDSEIGWHGAQIEEGEQLLDRIATILYRLGARH